MWKTLARSSGDGGIDLSVLSLYPKELSALLDRIETDLDEIPQMGTSESISSSNPIDRWHTSVETVVRLAAPYISHWWRWVMQEAGSAHSVLRNPEMGECLHAPEDTMIAAVRRKLATSSMPSMCMQVGPWTQPGLLNVLPVLIQEWVKLRTTKGHEYSSHVLVFYAMVYSTQDR